MKDNTILQVNNLKTHFFTDKGVIQAVDGVSFDIEEGEIVGLVGESGAGKSITARSILRLIDTPGQIVGGEIRFQDDLLFGLEEADGGSLKKDPEMLDDEQLRTEIRGNKIAMIFQDPMDSLNPVFRIGAQVRELIEINRDVGKQEAKDIAIEALREVGIPDPESRYTDYPHEFSGGMRQRVLIAMAFACQPDLIIADEPTTALDVTVEGEIINLVRDLQDKYDTSFLWITHDMAVIAELCDRVNVMYLGEIIEQADVYELFDDTHHPYTEALLESIPRPDLTVDELNPISGVMPGALNPPSGCRFHTRCPDAKEACLETHPSLMDTEKPNEHSVACIKYAESGYDESSELSVDKKAQIQGDTDD
jgi:peptide/nickel transport system ATP-binding protein